MWSCCPSVPASRHCVSLTSGQVQRTKPSRIFPAPIPPSHRSPSGTRGRGPPYPWGTPSLQYRMDADDHEFRETFTLMFESPLVGYSTCALTTLELDFGFEFEQHGLRSLTLFPPPMTPVYLERHRTTLLCPEDFCRIGERKKWRDPKLDLSKLELSNHIVNLILHNFTLHRGAGFSILRILLREGFEALDPERLRLQRPRVLEGL